MRFPLEFEKQHYGVMIISKKDFDSEKAHSQILWRIEFLRRTLSSTLHTFKHNPVHELCDRRLQPAGDRRVREIEEELIRQWAGKRVTVGERRLLAPQLARAAGPERKN
jgi:hypothetical protein